ncbi:MAG: polysaccharide deacetylase family protein [Deltaproteobacteria bacterium]|nr:polysaccharide deacetylase family protein [Deltaproteobacteria bacterium]
MAFPRDHIAYSALPDRPPLRLPKSSRVVVWTIVNLEEWDIQGPMPRTVLPPPGGVSAIPDVPNFAWFEYGMRVGFWRLKAMLDKHRIKATLSINASVCLSYPRIAEAARDAGWEFMGHSFTQKAMHLVEDQRETIRKSVEVIRQFTGKAPLGWLGPGLTETWETLDLLAEAGFQYIADWVNDEQPYEITTRAGTLVSLPYTVELNDIPIMLIQHHEAEEFFRRARDQFETLYAEGAKSARVMAIAVHPYISGVPHRIKYLDRLYAHLRKHKGVLFWTGEEILQWYRGQSRQGTRSRRSSATS